MGVSAVVDAFFFVAFFFVAFLAFFFVAFFFDAFLAFFAFLAGPFARRSAKPAAARS